MNNPSLLASAIKADAQRIITAVDSTARGNAISIKSIIERMRQQLNELERAA